MGPRTSGLGNRSSHALAVIACLALLSPSYRVAVAQGTEPQNATPTGSAPPAEQAPKIPNDQLDSLVAPIALYPDPLLAQTLAASTYPLEIIQLQQWMDRNTNLKDKALAEAVAKQPWDPSVQAMAGYPDVLQRMAGNIQWTTDLGNAFLAQQSGVMDAVQRMRVKAQGTGKLKTNAQQKVETQTMEGGKQVIVVEQANLDVVYVPSYDPVVVYGAAPPAYPYYPYTYPGYYAGIGLAFGTGLVLGAAWSGAWGHWGDCNWHGGDININNNNNFNRNVNRGQQGGKWQHNPQHRGNAPYGDRGTANKFGGTARGERGARGAGTRPGGGAGARPGGGAGARPGGGAGARPGGGGARPSTRPAGGGGNRVGNRSVSSGPSYGSRGGGFGGGNGNYARASSSRGGRSMGGGGFSRGGGGGRRR